MRRRDPLLAVVQLVLGVSMAFLAVFAVAIFLTIPLVFAFQERVLVALARQGAPPGAIGGVAVVIALAAIICVLGYLFLRHLSRIISSVGDGDPFVPVNADRLRAMAWISAVVHILAIPIAAFGHWTESLSRNMHFEVQIPLSGMFLALVLFILARVFREGTRMREELDGTV